MDPTGQFTTQQRTKIIEAYFAISSLTQRQCRGDFGRDNVPDRKTIQSLVGERERERKREREVEKTTYLNEEYFGLTSLSIHVIYISLETVT